MKQLSLLSVMVLLTLAGLSIGAFTVGCAFEVDWDKINTTPLEEREDGSGIDTGEDDDDNDDTGDEDVVEPDDDDDIADAGEEDKAVQKDCKTSDDCPGGQYCDYGKCYEGSGKDCAVTKDCPEYEECVLLKCRKKVVKEGELGGACYANNTCNEGLECVNKVCVTQKDAGGGEDIPDVGDDDDTGNDDDDVTDAGDDDTGEEDTGTPCESDCEVEGQRKCSSATQYKLCEKVGDCLIWSDSIRCPSGASCRGVGVCGTDECVQGAKECDGKKVIECQDKDANLFYEWVNTQTCSDTCDKGECLGCASDADCQPPTPKCYKSENKCVACLQSSDCGANQKCEDRICSCMYFPCGEACCEMGAICYQGKCCKGNCTNKECGDDGCGGGCGICNTPPSPICSDANTLKTYQASGTCDNFKCSYPFSSQNCQHGCLNGSCNDCAPNCIDKCGGASDGCGGTCTAACGSGKVCKDQACVACGGSMQPCCDGNSCGSGLACSGGNCVTCGGTGQPCCASDSCNTGNICQSGSCVACGGSSQPCCAGNSCNTSYICISNTCTACGNTSQPCCAGGVCSSGNSCHSDLCALHNWEQKNPSAKPSGRRNHAMVFTAANNRIMLFGGSDGARKDDTWEYDGSNWQSKSPSTKPSARTGHAMTNYNSGKIILFGGVDTATKDDTWQWDYQSSSWSLKSPSTKPEPRYSHAMAYNPNNGGFIVMFGGLSSGLAKDDTWVYQSDNWSAKSPSAKPTARYGHAMAFDSKRGKIVLFGGNDSSYFNDTWEWSGSNWVQLDSSNKPPKRTQHILTYDANRERVILYGGTYWDGTNNIRYDDTWEWDGVNWLELTPNNKPPVRRAAASAYDSTRKRVVLFGGYLTDPNYLSDTWELGLW